MDYIKNFDEYINYFWTLATSTTYFKFFQAGGTERIVSERLLSDTRSRVESPLMFCEWPFIKVNDYGSQNNLIRFTGAVVILENPDKEDWSKQDEAMNNTYNAVFQVINRMKIDSNSIGKKFIYFDLNTITIDPIENLMIDQWYGWRLEFQILVPAEVAIDPSCIDDSFWKKVSSLSIYPAREKRETVNY